MERPVQIRLEAHDGVPNQTTKGRQVAVTQVAAKCYHSVSW